MEGDLGAVGERLRSCGRDTWELGEGDLGAVGEILRSCGE